MSTVKTVDLEQGDIDVLLESLKYSAERIRDAPGIPYEMRQGRLAKIAATAAKLQAARAGQ